jgi:hypothetical protein
MSRCHKALGLNAVRFDLLFPRASAPKSASKRLSDEDSRPERVRLDGRVEGSKPFSKFSETWVSSPSSPLDPINSASSNSIAAVSFSTYLYNQHAC